MKTLTSFILRDLLRSRSLLIFAVLLCGASLGIIALGQGTEKSIASSLAMVQLVIPLFALLHTVSYIHQTHDFLEFCVTQPIHRATVVWGSFLAHSVGLIAAVILGVAIPILVAYPGPESLGLSVITVGLTLVFTALGHALALGSADKSRAIAWALINWVVFSAVLDGLLLLVLLNFDEYPLEALGLIMNFVNPISFARNFTLMQLEAASIMGYSGAVFVDFFTSDMMRNLSLLLFIPWTVLPLWAARRQFNKRDL